MNASPNQPRCGLFRLPAHLRDSIYDIVFCYPETESPINLVDASPPKDYALLLTCRQLYAEAKANYHSAVRQYWQNNSFFVLIEEHADPNTLIATKRSAIDAITALHNDIAEKLILEIRYRSLTFPFDVAGKMWYNHKQNLWWDEVDFEYEGPKTWPSLLVRGEVRRELRGAGFPCGWSRDDEMTCIYLMDKSAEQIEEARRRGGEAAGMKEQLIWLVEGIFEDAGYLE